jgi:hypothetical protein
MPITKGMALVVSIFAKISKPKIIPKIAAGRYFSSSVLTLPYFINWSVDIVIVEGNKSPTISKYSIPYIVSIGTPKISIPAPKIDCTITSKGTESKIRIVMCYCE